MALRSCMSISLRCTLCCDGCVFARRWSRSDAVLVQAPLGAAARLRLVLRLRRHGGGPAQGGGAGGAPAQDHVAGAVARREAGAALDARLPARLRRLSLSLLLVRQRLRHVSLMAARINCGGRGEGAVSGGRLIVATASSVWRGYIFLLQNVNFVVKLEENCFLAPNIGLYARFCVAHCALCFVRSTDFRRFVGVVKFWGWVLQLCQHRRNWKLWRQSLWGVVVNSVLMTVSLTMVEDLCAIDNALSLVYLPESDFHSSTSQKYEVWESYKMTKMCCHVSLRWRTDRYALFQNMPSFNSGLRFSISRRSSYSLFSIWCLLFHS